MRKISRDSVLIAAVAGLAAAYGLAINVGIISVHAAQVFSDYACWVVPLFAGGVCLWLSRRHAGRMRLGWTLLGASALAWGIGDAIWTYYELVLKTEPFPSLADLGFLAAVPLGAAAILCFWHPPRRSLLRTILDAVLIGLSVLLIGWAVLLRTLFEESSGTMLEQVLSLAYPVGDVLIIALVVFVWARASMSGRSPLLLIGAALTFLAIGDFGYAFLVAKGTYASGHPIDTGWIGGYLLVGLAAFRARNSERIPAEGTTGLRVLLPYAVLGIALVVTLFSFLRDGLGPVRVWGLVILLLVVVGRQFLMVTEQQSATIERLRSVDEMKNRFLHAVSHDLRTPLTFIEGVAEMLNNEEMALDPETQRDLISRLVKSSRRLSSLLAGLLDLDRLTRGVLEPSRYPTDLKALITSVVEIVNDSDHPIHIGGRPIVANVDPAQVERIIENLLVNAIRHTPAGTKVRAGAARTDEGVLLTVEDSGPGVPEELRESIFQPFVQAVDDQGRGSGIGLALVAKFAELHGGRAWVEQGRTRGARFQVLLGDCPESSECEPIAA